MLLHNPILQIHHFLEKVLFSDLLKTSFVRVHCFPFAIISFYKLSYKKGFVFEVLLSEILASSFIVDVL